MNKLLLLFFLLVIQILPKERYKIIFIRGKVKSVKLNRTVMKGDLLDDDDSLIFETRTDFVSLFSSQKGRLTISPVPGGRAAQKVTVDTRKADDHPAKNEFFASLKDNLYPSSGTHFLTSRSGQISDLNDLNNYFMHLSGADTLPIAIVDTLQIRLNKNAFNHRAEEFFYIKYDYNGEAIHKKLGYLEPNSKDRSLYLVIDRHLYEIDDKPIGIERAKDMKMYYYSNTLKSSTFIRDVHFKFSDRETVIGVLAALKKDLEAYYYSRQDKSSIIEADLFAEFIQDYGRTDVSHFNDLIKSIHEK